MHARCGASGEGGFARQLAGSDLDGIREALQERARRGFSRDKVKASQDSWPAVITPDDSGHGHLPLVTRVCRALASRGTGSFDAATVAPALRPPGGIKIPMFSSSIPLKTANLRP